MKGIFRNLTAAAAVAAISAACVSEATEWSHDSGRKEQGFGYLSFASEGLVVDERSEQVGSSQSPSSVTRAGNTDVDTYTVEIYNSADNTLAATFLYGERGSEPIELPAGTYYIKVFSGATPDSAWEDDPNTPTYGAYVDKYTDASGKTSAIEITKNNTKDNPLKIGTITCRLLTVKASVSFHKALRDLTTGTEVDLVLGSAPDERHKVYTEAEIGVVEKSGTTVVQTTPAKVCYLKPVEGQRNPLVLYLSTTFEGKHISRQLMSIATNVKAGEYRKISLNLDNADNGSLIITAEIETWVYDQRVDVDVATLAVLTEERIPDENDPNAPSIDWPSHSFDDTFALNDTCFDVDGNCTEPCQMTVSTKSPVAKFTVAVESTNTEFTEYIAANGLNTPTDLCSGESSPAKTALRSWGFPTTNIAGVTSRTFNLANLMTTLYPTYLGTHTFTMTVIDQTGLKSVYTLRIAVDLTAGSDPDIVWVGHDINQRYDTKDVADGVQILVKAKNGIESLKVRIVGALQLDGIVPQEFYLENPDDTQAGLSGTLTQLGFPVGDQVVGKHEVPFTISSTLIGMMGTFQGNTDFELTVKDTEGNIVTKAIKLVVSE